MAAFTYKLKAGDTFSLSGPLLEDDEVTPIDATGWSVRAAVSTGVRVTPSSNQVLEPEFTESITAAWLDSSAGVLRLSASSESTASWPIGPLKLDIELTTNTGDVISAPEYTFLVVRQYTP